MSKQDMFDMSMLNLNGKSKNALGPESDLNKNYAIGSRIQRSMSAPPIAEHVARFPPPMYAQSEYDDPQTDSSFLPEYYYYYAPKSHNPRLPISYNSWETMQKQFQGRNNASSLHRVQLSERQRLDDAGNRNPLSLTTASSQEDFDAAVAAAGGHPMQKFCQQSDQYCLSPTDSLDSNSSSSIRPMTKTLIDRIQEDFPRTPSPVFGYGTTPQPPGFNIADDAHATRQPDHVQMLSHPPSAVHGDFVHNMNRYQSNPNERTRSRMNFFAPGHYHPTYPPPGIHYGASCALPHQMYDPYDRYPRGMPPPPFMQYSSDGQYVESYDNQRESPQESRIASVKAQYNNDIAYSIPSPPNQHASNTTRPIPEYESCPESPHSFNFNTSVEDAQPSKAQRGNEKSKIATPLATTPQDQRSILLEDFRATQKTKKWELVDARGHIVEFAKDQHGSRFIQQKLETAKSDIKDIVFSEIYPVALILMTDVFGNYVVQKFFDHGNPDHVLQLMRTIQGRMVELALQMYGCRVIQKALETEFELEKLDLICELQGQVLKCVKDQNGNHVIQKCIEILPWKCSSSNQQIERVSFLLVSFVGNVYNLATHPYGCRVIQRVLENCTEQQMAPILIEIQDACSLLVEDQYGNYVIQHVLEHGQPVERCTLINKIYPDIVRFSYHKFASNVIEKCLLYASVDQLHVIIQHVMESDGNLECPLQVMMKDQYANYVVQKLIDVADANERDKMAAIIKTQAPHLKRYTFGKHILNRLEKLTGQKII